MTISHSHRARLHHILTIQSRKAEVQDCSCVPITVINRNTFVSFGSHSASGDFSPYCLVYLDIYGRYQVLAYHAHGLDVHSTHSQADNAMRTAAHFAGQALACANTALKQLGNDALTLKCLVCVH